MNAAIGETELRYRISAISESLMVEPKPTWILSVAAAGEIAAKKISTVAAIDRFTAFRLMMKALSSY
ncbi:MAG: hypothetical protein ACOY42_01090 [Pseudomonadota bacterium]